MSGTDGLYPNALDGAACSSQNKLKTSNRHQLWADYQSKFVIHRRSMRPPPLPLIDGESTLRTAESGHPAKGAARIAEQRTAIDVPNRRPSRSREVLSKISSIKVTVFKWSALFCSSQRRCRGIRSDATYWM